MFVVCCLSFLNNTQQASIFYLNLNLNLKPVLNEQCNHTHNILKLIYKRTFNKSNIKRMLNEKGMYYNGSTKCITCQEKDTIQHLLIQCRKNQQSRRLANKLIGIILNQYGPWISTFLNKLSTQAQFLPSKKMDISLSIFSCLLTTVTNTYNFKSEKSITKYFAKKVKSSLLISKTDKIFFPYLITYLFNQQAINLVESIIWGKPNNQTANI